MYAIDIFTNMFFIIRLVRIAGNVESVTIRHWEKTWYEFFLSIFRVKESTGWQQVFSSPRLDWIIDRVALNAKVMGGSLGDNDKMVAVASGTEIILWAVCPDGNGNEIGNFNYLWCRHKKNITIIISFPSSGWHRLLHNNFIQHTSFLNSAVYYTRTFDRNYMMYFSKWSLGILHYIEC